MGLFRKIISTHNFAGGKVRRYLKNRITGKTSAQELTRNSRGKKVWR